MPACFQRILRLGFRAGSQSGRPIPRRLAIERLGDRTPLDASGFDSPAVPEGETGPIVPDFTLSDVNPNSSSFNQGVSPRSYLEQVTGWYFTHST
jgi:hypothetical protein